MQEVRQMGTFLFKDFTAFLAAFVLVSKPFFLLFHFAFFFF